MLFSDQETCLGFLLPDMLDRCSLLKINWIMYYKVYYAEIPTILSVHVPQYIYIQTNSICRFPQ